MNSHVQIPKSILKNFALEIEKGTNNQFIVGDKSELLRLKEVLLSARISEICG